MLGFSLALRQLQEATQVKAKLEWGLALKLEGLTKNYEDQWLRRAQKKEDQWTRMVQQMHTTLREVLSQKSQINSVRLFPWFLSIDAMPSAGPACSVSEALTAISTPELKVTTASASMSSPAHWVSTQPPVLPVLDILAACTPVGHLFFTLTLGLKHKKWDHSSSGTPEGQSSKWPVLALRKTTSTVGTVLGRLS